MCHRELEVCGFGKKALLDKYNRHEWPTDRKVEQRSFYSRLLNPNQESTRTQTDITPHKKWKEQRGQTSKLSRALRKIKGCLLEAARGPMRAAAAVHYADCGRPPPTLLSSTSSTTPLHSCALSAMMSCCVANRTRQKRGGLCPRSLFVLFLSS